MERTDTCWYYRDQSWKTRAKLILVFFSCPFLSLSLVTHPPRPAPRSPPPCPRGRSLSLPLWSGNGRPRPCHRRRAAAHRPSRAPLPMYVLLRPVSRSLLFFFVLWGRGKIPLFLSSLFLPAWIDRLVTLLMCFPWAVELKKQISCSMQLSNLSGDWIAFKVRLSFRCFFSFPYNNTWMLFPFSCELPHLN
jgi:hypothetical protein